MKKRKGASLITVLAVFVVVSILAVTIMTVYVSTVKQTTYSSQIDQLNYGAISGLNIATSYIVNTNSEFLVKYDEFLAQNSNDRTKPFPIPLTMDEFDCVVYVTSTYNLDNSTGQDVVTIVYSLSSFATKNGIKSETVKLDITQVVTKKSTETLTEGNSTFTIGYME